MAGKVLIAGASGVVGSSAISAFASRGWEVTAISRRTPELHDYGAIRHLNVDLQDRIGATQSLSTLNGISHIVFAAVSEAPGLIQGWFDPAMMQTNLMMLQNCLEPI